MTLLFVLKTPDAERRRIDVTQLRARESTVALPPWDATTNNQEFEEWQTENQYSCGICDESFLNKQHLLHHLRQAHSNHKLGGVCTIINQRFVCREIFKDKLTTSKHVQDTFNRGICCCPRVHNLENIQEAMSLCCPLPSCSFEADSLQELHDHLHLSHFPWLEPPERQPAILRSHGNSSVAEEGRSEPLGRRGCFPKWQGEGGLSSKSCKNRRKDSSQQPATIYESKWSEQLGGIEWLQEACNGWSSVGGGGSLECEGGNVTSGVVGPDASSSSCYHRSSSGGQGLRQAEEREKGTEYWRLTRKDWIDVSGSAQQNKGAPGARGRNRSKGALHCAQELLGDLRAASEQGAAGGIHHDLQGAEAKESISDSNYRHGRLLLESHLSLQAADTFAHSPCDLGREAGCIPSQLRQSCDVWTAAQIRQRTKDNKSFEKPQHQGGLDVQGEPLTRAIEIGKDEQKQQTSDNKTNHSTLSCGPWDDPDFDYDLLGLNDYGIDNVCAVLGPRASVSPPPGLDDGSLPAFDEPMSFPPPGLNDGGLTAFDATTDPAFTL